MSGATSGLWNALLTCTLTEQSQYVRGLAPAYLASSLQWVCDRAPIDQPIWWESSGNPNLVGDRAAHPVCEWVSESEYLKAHGLMGTQDRENCRQQYWENRSSIGALVCDLELCLLLSSNLAPDVPPTHLSTTSGCAFYVAAIGTWNCLPPEMSSQTLLRFKCRLKTTLLSVYFWL